MRFKRFFKLMNEEGHWKVLFTSGNPKNQILTCRFETGTKMVSTWQAIMFIIQDRWRMSKY